MSPFSDIRKNWSDWTLASAAIAAIFNWFLQVFNSTGEKSVFALSTAILGLLSLLILDRIIERRTVLTGIHENIRQLRWYLTKRGHLVLSREEIERTSLRERILESPEPIENVAACGFTLFGLLVRYEGLLKECIDRGIGLEFLILDRYSVTIPPMAMQWLNGDSADYFDTHGASERAIDRLTQYANEHGTGSIEVRYLDSMPFQGLLAINPGKSNGELQVQMRVFGLPADQLPVILIRHTEEPKLFEKFFSEWCLLWGKSRPRAEITGGG